MTLGSEDGEKMMTIAEQLIQQGIEKGIQQGMQQGIEKGIQQERLRSKKEDLIDALEAKFDIIPKSMYSEIEAIEEVRLLATLLKKAVKAGSLGEFEKVLKEVK
jgi:flagellar biosynthesis/type III secretory pathway protein FliH